jgi:hypothetical protein
VALPGRGGAVPRLELEGAAGALFDYANAYRPVPGDTTRMRHPTKGLVRTTFELQRLADAAASLLFDLDDAVHGR